MRRAWVGLAVLSATLLVAALAWGETPAKPGAKAGGLSAAEKKAMRIVSIQASTSVKAGILVDVTFGGNMEQSLGRGGLKKGLVAVILHPKAAGSPTGYIAAQGAGALGQTLTRSVADKAGVIRNGKHFLFFVEAGGFGDVANVEVKALPKVPSGSRSRVLASASIAAEGWEGIDEVIAGDEKAADSLEGPLTDATNCDRVKAAQQSVVTYLTRAKRRSGTFEELKKLIEKEIEKGEKKTTKGQLVATAYLHSFGAPYGALMKAITGKTPSERFDSLKAALRSAKLDLKLVQALAAKNDKLIGRLTDLKGDYDLLIAACEAPPVLQPIRATFNSAEFTTFYKEDATDAIGRKLTYTWALSIPLDPACANGFKPNKPEENYASWYHADTSEGGPCDHSKYDASGSGHPGDVVVVVSNGIWNCAATFHGSQGEEGEVDTFGPFPQPCTRVH
jgi:hypothetical protein